MQLRRSLTALVAASLATTSLVGAAAAMSAPQAAGSTLATRDGSTSERAAASCWEIVRTFPAAASGTYWLQTPKLVAPQRFYCDMTTDGGGWVLVGRGREGWNWTHNGQ